MYLISFTTQSSPFWAFVEGWFVSLSKFHSIVARLFEHGSRSVCDGEENEGGSIIAGELARDVDGAKWSPGSGVETKGWRGMTRFVGISRWKQGPSRGFELAYKWNSPWSGECQWTNETRVSAVLHNTRATRATFPSGTRAAFESLCISHGDTLLPRKQFSGERSHRFVNEIPNTTVKQRYESELNFYGRLPFFSNDNCPQCDLFKIDPK